MGEDRSLNGQFEELTLRAVALGGEDSYGVNIRHRLCIATGRDVSYGAVYTALDRLEEKGFISSRLGAPTAERGGRAKKHFKIEIPGLRALADAEGARGRLAVSASSIVGPVGQRPSEART